MPLHQPASPHRSQVTCPIIVGGRGVGVSEGVLVGVKVGVKVGVGVKVDVAVAVCEGVAVAVGVKVGVEVEVGVLVTVEVNVAVRAAVGVRVIVGVLVGVREGVGVAVEGGPTYSTSMERKSTYPPEADNDQERQPGGTVIAILTKPGNVVEPLYKFQDTVEEQVRRTAVPTFVSRVKPTMTSK